MSQVTLEEKISQLESRMTEPKASSTASTEDSVENPKFEFKRGDLIFKKTNIGAEKKTRQPSQFEYIDFLNEKLASIYDPVCANFGIYLTYYETSKRCFMSIYKTSGTGASTTLSLDCENVCLILRCLAVIYAGVGESKDKFVEALSFAQEEVKQMY